MGYFSSRNHAVPLHASRAVLIVPPQLTTGLLEISGMKVME